MSRNKEVVLGICWLVKTGLLSLYGAKGHFGTTLGNLCWTDECWWAGLGLSFPGDWSAEHRNLVKFWFAYLGFSRRNFNLDLIWLLSLLFWDYTLLGLAFTQRNVFRDSSTLLYTLVIYSFLFLSHSLLYEDMAICLSIYLLIFGLFPVWGYYE